MTSPWTVEFFFPYMLVPNMDFLCWPTPLNSHRIPLVHCRGQLTMIPGWIYVIALVPVAPGYGAECGDGF